MWIRARGLKLDRPMPGEITSLLISQCGDLLCEVVFDVVVDSARHRVAMLLPVSDAFIPVDDDELARLRAMLREFTR